MAYQEWQLPTGFDFPKRLDFQEDSPLQQRERSSNNNIIIIGNNLKIINKNLKVGFHTLTNGLRVLDKKLDAVLKRVQLQRGTLRTGEEFVRDPYTGDTYIRPNINKDIWRRARFHAPGSRAKKGGGGGGGDGGGHTPGVPGVGPTVEQRRINDAIMHAEGAGRKPENTKKDDPAITLSNIDFSDDSGPIGSARDWRYFSDPARRYGRVARRNPRFDDLSSYQENLRDLQYEESETPLAELTDDVALRFRNVDNRFDEVQASISNLSNIMLAGFTALGVRSALSGAAGAAGGAAAGGAARRAAGGAVARSALARVGLGAAAIVGSPWVATAAVVAGVVLTGMSLMATAATADDFKPEEKEEESFFDRLFKRFKKDSSEEEKPEETTPDASQTAAVAAEIAKEMTDEEIGIRLGLTGRVTGKYGEKRETKDEKGNPIKYTHKGIDFAGKKGTPVLAFADGTVVDRVESRSYGKRIVLDHGDYRTSYSHLDEFKVKKGDTIKAGDEIGKVGSTGRSNAPHLHFEMGRENSKVAKGFDLENPTAFIADYLGNKPGQLASTGAASSTPAPAPAPVTPPATATVSAPAPAAPPAAPPAASVAPAAPPELITPPEPTMTAYEPEVQSMPFVQSLEDAVAGFNEMATEAIPVVEGLADITPSQMIPVTAHNIPAYEPEQETAAPLNVFNVQGGTNINAGSNIRPTPLPRADLQVSESVLTSFNRDRWALA